MRFHTRKAVILIFTTTKIQNLMTLLCALQSWKVNFVPVTWTRWVSGTMASTVLGSRQKSGYVAAQTLTSTAARRGSKWSQRIPPGKSCCMKNHEYRATDMHVWCVICRCTLWQWGNSRSVWKGMHVTVVYIFFVTRQPKWILGSFSFGGF
jgi:hypothetical protein